MTLTKMVLAIVGTLVAALTAQVILAVGLRVVSPWLSHASLTVSSPIALVGAYTLGAAFVAFAAGIALGKLAHTHMPTLVLIVGAASLLLSYTVAGRGALPHGWQIAGYAAQLAVILFIAQTIARGRLYAPGVRSPAT